MGFSAAETLRREIPGLRVLLGPSGGLKAQFTRADKSGARFALILGDEELATGRFSLKDMRQDQGQQSLAENELPVTLAAALAPLD
jgi:histidyl-tRNA synthetase